MSTRQLREWALHLAAMGWHVFPITAGSKKPPAVKDWENRATTDPDRITRCWQSGQFNLGIATGPSGLVVVDLDTAKDPADGPDGADAFAELATARGVTLPATYTVRTPSGGRHLYFTAPPGVHLRNSRRDLCPNVDTRAEGGYVVAPGSITPTGGYDLVDDTDPAELPAWIIQCLLERRPSAGTGKPAAAGNPTAYAAAAMHGEADRVRTAPPHQHNAVLSRAAWRLGQLIGAGVLDHATARAELAAAGHTLVAADCDCTPREVERVIDAGLTAGARHPRAIESRKDVAA